MALGHIEIENLYALFLAIKEDAAWIGHIDIEYQ